MNVSACLCARSFSSNSRKLRQEYVFKAPSHAERGLARARQ